MQLPAFRTEFLPRDHARVIKDSPLDKYLPAWLRDFVLTRSLMERALQAAGVICMAVTWTLLAIRLSRPIGWEYPPGAVPLTLSLFAAIILFSIAEAFYSPGTNWAARAFCVFTWIVGAAHLPYLIDHPARHSVPPLFDIVIVALFFAPFAFGTRLGILTAVCFGAYYVLLRPPVIGLFAGTASALVWGCVGVAVALFLELAVQTADDIQETSDRNGALRDVVIRAQSRWFEQVNWNGLIHDKILGALRLAVREPELSDNAAELADQALGVLAQTTPDRVSRSFRSDIESNAERLGLDVSVDVHGDLPDVMAIQTMTDAAVEALTNVARHSGQTRADVRVRADGHHVKVVIRDQGVGFLRTGNRGAGIPVGIKARLESIGGQADVLSVPQEGTVVTLRWEDRPPPEPPFIGWSSRRLLIVGIPAGLLMLLHFLAGASAGGYRDTGVLATGILAVAILTIATTFIPQDTRSWLALCVAMGLVTIPLTLNLSNPTTLDWRYWWGGAFATALASLSFAIRPISGWVGLFLLVLIEGTTRAALGWPIVVQLGWNYIIAFAFTLLASSIRLALDRSALSINRAAVQSGTLRVRVIQQQEQDYAAMRDGALLRSDAKPLLERICAGGVLTESEREAMSRLEARLRDRLIAGPLITDALEDAVASARRRGVRVELLAEAAPLNAEIEHFRSLVIAALALSPNRGYLSAQWRPLGRRRGSIAVVGCMPPDAAARMIAATPRGARCGRSSAATTTPCSSRWRARTHPSRSSLCRSSPRPRIEACSTPSSPPS